MREIREFIEEERESLAGEEDDMREGEERESEGAAVREGPHVHLGHQVHVPQVLVHNQDQIILLSLL